MPYNLKPEITFHHPAHALSSSEAYAALTNYRHVLIETYPGTRLQEVRAWISASGYRGLIVDTMKFACVSAKAFRAAIAPDLTTDRVFGRFTHHNYRDFFDLDHIKQWLAANASAHFIVIGIGAHLFAHQNALLIYADLPRWEIQTRYRKGEPVYFGASREADTLSNFKRGYFVEWRMADRVKRDVWDQIDFFLDTARWQLLTGNVIRHAVQLAARHPFRLVPYFDVGVWGGTWMQKHFHLPPHPSGHNYAWGFDGVPEENSVIFAFSDGVTYEMPALNIVLFAAKALLGEAVYNRFGEEFPIRFDMLDTMGGQNLSLQVHPTTRYAQEHFGLAYPQEESYYVLAAHKGAKVYLGLKNHMSLPGLGEALRAAQTTNRFDVSAWVNVLPVTAHAHLLHPAGCVHASGANTMVLEISSTPYIFTFKLWDWARVDLDGKPRPINIERGLAVIDTDFNAAKVEAECVSLVRQLPGAPGVSVEKTGLHPRHFIETRRYTLAPGATYRVPRVNGVSMLNMVEGKTVEVISPRGQFSPWRAGYAETFIVPAACTKFSLHNPTQTSIIVIHAYVRH